MERYLFIGTIPKAEWRQLPEARAFVIYQVQRRQYHEGRASWIDKLQVFEKKKIGYTFIGYYTECDLRELIEQKGFRWSDVLLLVN